MHATSISIRQALMPGVAIMMLSDRRQRKTQTTAFRFKAPFSVIKMRGLFRW